MAADLIAMFEFELTKTDVAVVAEKHYRLVSPDELSPDELAELGRQNAELEKAVDHREVFRLVAKPLWKLGGKFEKLIRWSLDHSNLQLTR